MRSFDDVSHCLDVGASQSNEDRASDLSRKGAQTRNPMGLQSPPKRSPPEGLGHLEFFFYDSDLLQNNQSEPPVADEVGMRSRNEVPEALMPNWPGYGDEPLTEWIINDGDEGDILSSVPSGNSENGGFNDELLEL